MKMKLILLLLVGVTSANAQVNGNFAQVNATTYMLQVPRADPTGATDNSSIFNSAIAAQVASGSNPAVCLGIPFGKFYVPSLSNPTGVCLTGPGVLLKSINQTTPNSGGTNVTATKAQNSFYADSRLFVSGQEYAMAWFNCIYAFRNGMTAPVCNVKFSGDSTTAGTNAGIYTVDYLFGQMALNRGMTNVTTTNAGHSGMSSANWLSTYLTPDIATCPLVYVVRWGINDAYFGITPAQTINNMRTGLAQIRASCDIETTTIVLETPSATNDNPNGRSASYYEQLRNGYEQAAKDYNAAFVDLYGLMRDVDYPSAINECDMDTPYTASGTPLVHIHPGPCKTPLYTGILADFLIPAGIKDIYGTANFQNISGFAGNSLLASALPATYPPGQSWQRVIDTNGWPYNGAVFTNAFADGTPVIQYDVPYEATTGSTFAFRVSTGTNTWNAWSYLGSGTNGVDYYWTVHNACATAVGQPIKCNFNTTLPGAMPDANWQLSCTATPFSQVGGGVPDGVCAPQIMGALPTASGSALSIDVVQIMQNGGGGGSWDVYFHAHHN